MQEILMLDIWSILLKIWRFIFSAEYKIKSYWIWLTQVTPELVNDGDDDSGDGGDDDGGDDDGGDDDGGDDDGGDDDGGDDDGGDVPVPNLLKTRRKRRIQAKDSSEGIKSKETKRKEEIEEGEEIEREQI